MSASSMRRIGKYQVIRELGSGGMAEVAIKLMKENEDMDDELRRRFRREAEATAALSHKNIVTLYEFDEVDGVPYIVMENLGGTDLAELLRGRGGKNLAVDQCVDIALQAAAGLGYAHGRGVVHRDIKPSNVRVLDDGLVKIMDFGIAHVASSTITKTGVSIGTPQYMSPEQINGSKVDHAPTSGPWAPFFTRWSRAVHHSLQMKIAKASPSNGFCGSRGGLCRIRRRPSRVSA